MTDTENNSKSDEFTLNPIQTNKIYKKITEKMKDEEDKHMVTSVLGNNGEDLTQLEDMVYFKNSKHIKGNSLDDLTLEK